MSPLESALAYAAVGIAVIPCEPASKQPCGALVPRTEGLIASRSRVLAVSRKQRATMRRSPNGGRCALTP
jgi:hypothetical protein